MINIKRILCPTDLSPHSGKAVRYAAALARAHEAELIFLHCTPDIDGEEKLRLSVLEELPSIDAGWRLIAVTAVDVGEAIMMQAQVDSADMIVMRSRRRPHRAALLGSTAESVCRSAPCPVLVLHNDEQELDGSLARVLVAYDFSDYSELALKYGLSIAQEHQAELHLLHVLPPHSVGEPEIAWFPVALGVSTFLPDGALSSRSPIGRTLRVRRVCREPRFQSRHTIRLV